MFQPGISGNTRGRPRGSLGGRAQALAALDRMLSKECNQQAIFDALEKELQADPARFFRNTVVPLIPRSTREALPPDANDDWLPMDRTPPSDPPPVLEPYVPPPPRTYPPPSVKQSSSGIPGLQPTAYNPAPVSGHVLRPPTSPLLSFTCYLLLLIPFALKPDSVPHPVPDLLSRIVRAACVPVNVAAVCDPRPCQPAPKEPCRLRMKGGGPVLLSTARPLQTLTRLTLSQRPGFSLLFIVINSLLRPPAPSPHTLQHVTRAEASRSDPHVRPPHRGGVLPLFPA